MLDHALALVELIDQASNTDEVMESMQRAVGPFGFEHYFIAGCPRPGQKFEDIMFANRVPRAMQRIIVKEQYIQVSPAIRHCRRTAHPFEWKKAPYDRESELRAAELVDLVTEFGLSNGIMVPVHGPSGCEGCAWFAGDRLELTARHIRVVHLVALYAFERLRSFVNKRPPVRRNLTPREREALAWVALGKSAWEIGEILHIAKRTVDEHTQTAMRKLGASNRTHAVAIALLERIIQL